METPTSPTSCFPLNQLPDMALEHIFLYLTFEGIAKIRRVNRRFNTTGKRLLNKGFKNAEKYHLKCLKDVKAMLPRRESERRNHKLSRHCDILTAIETRISLLSMTFIKYVDLDLCCFIPGKVIDEIFSVLRTIQTDENPPRAYEILQELRDISSMAMEYFDEKIVPSLPKQLVPVSPLKFGSPGSYISGMAGIVSSGSGFSLSVRYPELDVSTPVSSRSILPPDNYSLARGQSEPPPVRRVNILRDLDAVSKSNKKLVNRTNRIVRFLKKQADTAKSAVKSQNKKISELDKRIDQQNEVIEQQNARLAEQEEKLAEMNRRLLENEQITADIVQSAHEKARPALAKSAKSTSGARKRSAEDREDSGPCKKSRGEDV